MTNALRTFDNTVARAVTHFSSYVNEMESLISRVCELDEQEINNRIVPSILNGEATFALQRLVPVSIRKDAGLFFTSKALAERVADCLTPFLEKGSKILDPACGAGNLLLACARHIPVGRNLTETLSIWGERILGYDLHVEFIRAAQLRLALLALCIHPGEFNALASIQAHQIFQGLEVGDVFAQPHIDKDACIAANPPFGYIPAPTGCNWASGKIQAAALFIERLLVEVNEGQHIVAILPDVLRSGTRYIKWRKLVASLCCSIDIEPAGRFDDNTDVDVFIMHAIRGSQNRTQYSWHTPLMSDRQCGHVISDFFDVRVGPVVPHRNPLEGPKYPYIHARTAPAWQTIDLISEERQYAGTVFSPPFLVIHRTSSPSDKHRCIATIVNEKRDVAVENHLLVLQPRNRSLRSCQQLLETLKSSETDEWLNTRIRCRHLTVSAIRELPCRAIGTTNL